MSTKTKRIYKITIEVPEVINGMPVDIYLEFLFKSLPFMIKNMLQTTTAEIKVEEELNQ